MEEERGYTFSGAARFIEGGTSDGRTGSPRHGAAIHADHRYSEENADSRPSTTPRPTFNASFDEKTSLRAVCSHTKYREVPAAHNRCLVQQLHRIEIHHRESRPVIVERGQCSTSRWVFLYPIPHRRPHEADLDACCEQRRKGFRFIGHAMR